MQSTQVTLTIEDFSCIKSARFDLAPVTVLIGPQGSGKSLTIKLLYFFVDILARQYTDVEKGVGLEDFKRETARLFKVWFPPSAWGKERFNISLSAGPFYVRVLRRMSGGACADDVAITFSDFYKKQYNMILETHEDLRSSNKTSADILRRTAESAWKIRERHHAFLRKELGDAFIASQTFIPAGRAFFTSIGRLVAAIEQGSSLDPVTIRFAKLFASLRDYASHRMFFLRESTEDRRARQEVMIDLFGGEIKFEGDSEFVESTDGRKIPFTALSSGQQELLPMWLLIDLFAARGADAENREELFYIEEPEAHLFPVAQSRLMDFLIGQLVSRRAKRRLIITTHSPYILSKINTFLKAGSLGRTKRHGSAVQAIVPKECWLTPKHVRAYALHEGTLVNLLEADGLIDTRYIDSVSDDVSHTFDNLLDIEYSGASLK